MAAGRGTRDNRISQQYVYGNAVPKRINDPYRRRTPMPQEEIPSREQIRRERARQEHERIARRNRQRAQRLDLRYTLFLLVSVALVFVVCVNFLRYTSAATNQSRVIAGLEKQLAELTDENVATKERISNAIDLDEVYRVASEELGMSYADEARTVYYHGNNSDYVKQYKDIPQ